MQRDRRAASNYDHDGNVQGFIASLIRRPFYLQKATRFRRSLRVWRATQAFSYIRADEIDSDKSR